MYEYRRHCDYLHFGGGCGGGKPDSAMGGGKDPVKVDNALALVDDFVSQKV